MKKSTTIPLLLILVLSMTLLAACDDNRTEELPNIAASQSTLPVPPVCKPVDDGQTDRGPGKALIVYFTKVGSISSSEDADAVSGASLRVGDTSKAGTTEVIAGMVQAAVGGDLFRIETVEPYPEDYQSTVKQATEERRAGDKPSLKTKVNKMDDYDVVYLGYPIWGMSLPAPLVSFLSEYDFSGKTIIPFCTHAGYGPGQTVSAIRELVPGAAVLDGFEIERTKVSNAEEAVSAWLREIRNETRADAK
ncbi:flavodoxin [Gorillibacterium timonense]|uniref:flavodoxin n=1 Tax=Gorillibacterium timonense TaxID=1689269 RepID=UPI00071E1032|nr:flavodoxin [Gorillibacterium timonense]